ncbi:MAG: hypothetical protein LBE13_21280 [Bacteroidales bacterium]|jgi:hypothetical protein|nr:hypothetical protein [Bacteroidales bacterium]
MTSYELISLYDELLMEINKLNSYSENIDQLIEYVNTRIDNINNIVITERLDQNSIGQINNYKNEIINKVNNFAITFDLLKNHSDLLKIIESISNMRKQNMFSNFIDEVNNAEELLRFYEEVTQNIYSYVKSKNQSDLIVMYRSVNVAFLKYTGLKNEYNKIKEYVGRLESKIDNSLFENGTEIYLHFYNDNTDFLSFLDHFNAIQVIYNEIKYYITDNAMELKIIKIESGSFLDKLLGDKNIITIMCELMHKSIELIFNKYTFEGKLTRKNELAKMLTTEIDLVSKLESIGINVGEETKKNISKTYTIISEKILKLAGTSSRIQINEELYSLEGSREKKYLLESKTLLIEESIKNSPPSESGTNSKHPSEN